MHSYWLRSITFQCKLETSNINKNNSKCTDSWLNNKDLVSQRRNKRAMSTTLVQLVKIWPTRRKTKSKRRERRRRTSMMKRKSLSKQTKWNNIDRSCLHLESSSSTQSGFALHSSSTTITWQCIRISRKRRSWQTKESLTMPLQPSLHIKTSLNSWLGHLSKVCC